MHGDDRGKDINVDANNVNKKNNTYMVGKWIETKNNP